MGDTTITGDSGIHTRVRWFISDTLAIARRSAAHIRQTPEKLLDVTMQPLMFVLLFAFAFGGIHVAGGSYREYLVGGILVQTIFFGMMGPAISIATDLKEGVLERFRSLPMARSAYLFGLLTAEFSAMLLAIVIMTVSGLIVGWGISASFASAIAGYGLLLLLAALAIWIGTLLGIAVRSPDAVMGLAFIVIFPLTFVSSALVGTGTLPDELRPVAEWNRDQHDGGGADAVRQPDGGAERRRLAARASGVGVRHLVCGRPRRGDPADDAALPAQDHGLDAGLGLRRA